MKVILLKDVARLGRKNEVKEVPDGHAINFLIPRKLAIIATAESLRRTEEMTSHRSAQAVHTQETFDMAVKSLQTSVVPYIAEANEQGGLFKGIHASEIALILKNAGYAILSEQIVLPQPIKHVGRHEILLKHGSSTGVCILEVKKK